MTHVVTIFAEGDLEDCFSFEDEKEADAFARGAVQGSSYYGSGCGAYVLPNDLDEMRDCEGAQECRAAIRKARELGAVLPEGDEP